MKRLLIMTTIAFAAMTAAASASEPTPFGNSCTAERGIRWCPATDLSQRPTSFDGTPIDADVTLPETGSGPWPTIVVVHGYGGNKTSFETSGSGSTNGLDNVSYAKRGYAVLNVSMRGFGRSCGHDPSTRTAGCSKGYVHLDDTRFEARDLQFLLGKLVDGGIADKAALGATGASYGGGVTLELAYLKNRIRNLSGSYSTWKSPNGTSLSLKAAWPIVPWSDLASALTPNGRYLDFDSRTAGLSISPAGVAIQTYISGLYSSGLASGWYTKALFDPLADLTTWKNQIFAGEPYSAGALANLKMISDYHGGYSVGGTPSALLIENGWSDDLFPPAEALRVYMSQRAAGNMNVRLLFDDRGHARAQNKADAAANANKMGAEFFDSQLRGIPGGPAAGSATAMTTTCAPNGVAKDDFPSGGPWTASSWQAIHPGAVAFSTTTAQTIVSTGGDANTGFAIDPILGSAGACGRIADLKETGVATYSFNSKGFTLLGLPTIQATIKTTGLYGQIAARLWDVSSGKRRLVSRGVYRLTKDQSGVITFQLHGNGYEFESGHRVKLELLPKDKAYYQASKGNFSVAVSKLALALPTHEAPDPAKGITAPALGKFTR
ncbi:MAG: alpha/beta fold hydrolase [Actinomycetes bacterium]